MVTTGECQFCYCLTLQRYLQFLSDRFEHHVGVEMLAHGAGVFSSKIFQGIAGEDSFGDFMAISYVRYLFHIKNIETSLVGIVKRKMIPV